MTSVAARRMAGGEVWVASTGNDSTVVVTRWVVVMVMVVVTVMVPRLLEEGDSVTAVVDGVIKLGAGMTMMTPAQYQHLSPCPGLALELHLLPLPGLPRPLLLVARDTCRVDLLDRGVLAWDKVCR